MSLPSYKKIKLLTQEACPWCNCFHIAGLKWMPYLFSGSLTSFFHVLTERE
uniref:Uncharacterized protein n=1 Tax=Arundo donax TaxID=35708 RepID=A0A0A9DYI0_ARUDO